MSLPPLPLLLAEEVLLSPLPGPAGVVPPPLPPPPLPPPPPLADPADDGYGGANSPKLRMLRPWRTPLKDDDYLPE